jgi:hypothetical protein
MNYNILPRNLFNIDINLKFTKNQIEPCVSYSLIYYLNDSFKQICDIRQKLIENNEEITVDCINKAVNTYEFIHYIVSSSFLSTNKINSDCNIFFELMEIFQLCNINDILYSKNKLNIAHITHNCGATKYLLNMIRENNDDFVICENFEFNYLYNEFIKNKFQSKFDLMIIEFKENDYYDINNYIKNICLTLVFAINYQNNNGTIIIKIDNMFYKPIIDFLFILSSVYEKTYIIKPTISNVTKSDKYIICKMFDLNFVEKKNIINEINHKLANKLMSNEFKTLNLCSILNNNIPYYSFSKIEELNAIIGQQQLEAFDQIINIFKNKNREEKLKSLKRNHMQKCIQWCEKNQLPHNKFIDKINIFLIEKKQEIDKLVSYKD